MKVDNRKTKIKCRSNNVKNCPMYFCQLKTNEWVDKRNFKSFKLINLTDIRNNNETLFGQRTHVRRTDE